MTHHCPNHFATTSPQELEALLANARGLQNAWRSGTEQRPLRGKNVALLCDAADDGNAALFQRAAATLGAQVARLRPSLSERSAPQDVQDTARVLGRLYDAVDCVGMAADLVRRIGDEAGVPVFEAIGSTSHPTTALADLLDDATPIDDRRCLVIQAVLLAALG